MDNNSPPFEHYKSSRKISLARFLLEGFNHRYIVRKKNVTGIHSLDIGHNPAVEVCYRIGEEDLAFVLHKGLSVGYISTTLMLNPMLVKNPSLKLYKQLSRALGLSDKK